MNVDLSAINVSDEAFDVNKGRVAEDDDRMSARILLKSDNGFVANFLY